MATAKKLPSGSWRCLVFSHYEYVTGKDGNVKKKRMISPEIFQSDCLDKLILKLLMSFMKR